MRYSLLLQARNGRKPGRAANEGGIVTLPSKSVDQLDNGRATLAKLMAQKEIEAAIANYAIGLDDRDANRFISAFHEDAVLDVAKGRLEGRPAILAWAKDLFRYQTMAHLSGNHNIDVIDENNAKGVGGAFALSSLDDGSVILAFGRLTDRYSKIDEKWRISHRRVAVMSSFKLSGATALIIDGKLLVDP